MSDNSDYVFVFTASDASSSGYQNSSQPNSSVPRGTYAATMNSNFPENDSYGQPSTTNNTLPPSYEEAIANSVNPSTFTVTPVAQSVSARPLERIFVVPNDLEEEGACLLTKNDNNGSDVDKSKLSLNDGMDHGEGGSSYNREIPSQTLDDGATSLDMNSPPPKYTISDAEFQVSDNGVTSSDPKLNREAESLYRFFIAHNDKPQMAISIHGYHSEWVEESYTYTDEGGNTKWATRSKHIEVTDFKFTYDLTDYILPNGEIHLTADKSPELDIMQLLKDYVEHKNILKEIEMRKVVLWDYESLTKAVSSTIRSQGYRNDIRITYPMRNHVVVVQSDHKFARLTRKFWFKFLCFITCLWIILLPLSWLYKKSYKNQLRSDFQMNIGPRDWFQQNVGMIVANVKWL
ncbi:12304_t:CDS:2 [Acaulospora morrowiae]|uniref:12304_t:CDS:1 n=1 Tax=Acaulospora morrowiae TaxID=94023 RepID=A0A9N8YS19_9GLOM|nr:12304_t:CDS:2 [Acaulospora morrowiae]